MPKDNKPHTNNSLMESLRTRTALVKSSSEAAKSGVAVLYIPLEKIVLHEQVRKTFDDVRLLELANSLRSMGQQQPITVMPEGDKYRVVSGERRVRALKLINHPTVMAVLQNVKDEKEIAIAQLVENLQREDMSAYEIGVSFLALTQNGGLSKEDLADKIGKNRRYVYKMLAVTKLPDALKDLLVRRVLNDTMAIEQLVKVFSQFPKQHDRIIELVLKAAETGMVSRSDVHDIADRIFAESPEGEKPQKVRKTAMPLGDVEICPGNAQQLKANPNFSHYKFPGGNIRIGCLFSETEGGEMIEGGQVIPTILTEDPSIGIVEFAGKLYEVPWTRIHITGVTSHHPRKLDENGNPVARGQANKAPADRTASEGSDKEA